MRTLAGMLMLALASLLASGPPALALSDKEEIRIGEKVVQELKPQGLTQEECLTATGEDLRQQFKRKDLPWEWFVVEKDKELNAFAAPGGKVFITRKYYDLLDQDQLSFVVGHEMAHVEKRHYQRKLEKARTLTILDILLGAAGVGGGARTAAGLAETGVFARYSRRYEKEADLVGFQTAVAAGYDAEGGVEALSKLEKQGGGGPQFLEKLFGTHPLLKDRETRLKILASRQSAPTAKPHYCAKMAPIKHWALSPASLGPSPNRTDLAIRVEGKSGKPLSTEDRQPLYSMLAATLQRTGKLRVVGTLTDSTKRSNSNRLKEWASQASSGYLLVVSFSKLSDRPAGKLTKQGQDRTGQVEAAARLLRGPDLNQVWSGPESRELTAFESSYEYERWSLGDGQNRTGRALAKAALAAMERIADQVAGKVHG